MSGNQQLLEFYKSRTEALELEVKRLNEELLTVKTVAQRSKMSDPNFLKPLSEIETNYQIIKK